MDGQLSCWVACAYLSLLSPHLILKLLSHIESIENLFELSAKELLALGLTSKQVAEVQNVNWDWVHNDLRWAEQPNNYLLGITDPRYPELLKEISDPPLLLFVQGNVKAMSAPQIAIVGARRATVRGVKHAGEFAAALSASGLGITSGLALGIDTAAHQGALQAGGITIAVLGTGLDKIYPKRNQALFDSILANQGAVISELPRSAPAFPHHFPMRNRIVTGLSLGVLVVEAALKSGSLISARLAMEAGREVFALPGPVGHPLSAGCHALIRQGVKLVETSTDILEELHSFKAMFTSSETCDTKRTSELSSREAVVFNEVQADETPIDVIILRSGLTAGEVSSILLFLELEGFVEATANGYTRCTV